MCQELADLEMLTLFLENFVLIFVAIDPITILPIFASFTQGLNKKDLVTLCLRSTLTNFISFLVIQCFKMMGININSFRIVGGLFLMVEMVFEQRQKRREQTAESAIDDEELSSLACYTSNGRTRCHNSCYAFI